MLGILIFSLSPFLASYEIFIYRPDFEKTSLSREFRISVQGEFFGHLQLPSTFPSFNDRSGPEDRWNFGFRNVIFLTPSTSFLAQLVTHDDGGKRTKFDWHFSLRQHLLENLVLIIGHDSDHDSDHQSLLNQKPYFINRNYIGIGIPYDTGKFYLEPFIWFFHHTSERGHLDLSGNKLKQEYGLRLGFWSEETLGLHLQILFQSEELFSRGQTLLSDLILRVRLADWLELSLGGSLWKDIETTRFGERQKFYKLFWGIAIPF